MAPLNLHVYILLTKADSFFCSNTIDCLLINITLSWKTSYLKESLLSDQTFISIFIFSVLLQRSISFTEKVMMKVVQSCPTLCKPVDYTVHGMNSLGQNTGVGGLSLLQGIFPTQGWNPGLPHCSGFFTSWATRERETQLVLRTFLSFPTNKQPSFNPVVTWLFLPY